MAPAVSQLYVRRLDQLKATLLPGTDDASSPFFSPDGRWIAFFAGGKLKKISVTGGAPVTVCDAANSRGGAWSDDDTHRVAADWLRPYGLDARVVNWRTAGAARRTWLTGKRLRAGRKCCPVVE